MSQALKRRLFFVWSLWVWLVWLSSGELMESRHLAGIFKNLLTPPWPHGWDAVQAACLAGAGAGAVLLAGTGMGEMLVKFVGWSGWSQGNITPPVPLDTRNLAGPETLGRRAQLLLALAVGLPALAVLTQALGLLGLAVSRNPVSTPQEPGAPPASPKPTPKLVVFGNVQWVTNQLESWQANFDLVANAVNWLAGSEETISIRSKQISRRVVYMDNVKARLMWWTTLLLTPLAVLGVGLLQWWRRRSL